PAAQTAPLIFASPHSGRDYPPEFVAQSRLDPVALRRSEDSFVDELYGAAPGIGAPLLLAHFPRAFIDPNREPYELDPAMFSGPLPEGANTNSPRVKGGLGTIARVVTNGAEIYRDRLPPEEAERRVVAYYTPYHDALAGLIEQTRARFGCCLLIDCHSMPSIGGPMDRDPGDQRVDFVLGDRYGTSCPGPVIDLVARTLEDMGYVVRRNDPYAGGFTTLHYSRPEKGVHTLQIEVNRALYMDEETITRTTGLETLKARITDLMVVMAREIPGMIEQ
ncbi:MAG: N-formylglutamate amidohydrolase, partial [Rhodospirillales bacterium]|nr:N-formylglutamate amidohydrolase [Rhodospirillales bacterium]